MIIHLKASMIYAIQPTAKNQNPKLAVPTTEKHIACVAMLIQYTCSSLLLNKMNILKGSK